MKGHTNLLFFIFLLSCHSLLAQSSMVDDSTKTRYGTNTTRFFTKDMLLWEQRIFFKKDTFVIPPLPPLPKQLSWEQSIENYFDDLDWKPDTILLQRYNLLKMDSASNSDSLNLLVQKNTGHLKWLWLRQKQQPSDSLARQRAFERRLFLRPYKNHYYTYKADTSIRMLHNYNHIYERTQMNQTLGMLGTAHKPVYPTAQNQVGGYDPGFTIYNVYATDPKKVEYLHSRSPYTRFTYINSTAKEDRVRAEFGRNIARDWNIGFEYQRITSTRNLAQVQAFRNFLASGQDFVAKTNYRSPNQRYHLLANYTYFVHKVNEQGGLRPFRTNAFGQTEQLPDAAVPDGYNRTWPTVLNANRFSIFPWDVGGGQIFSRDRRMAYHLYHQYDLLPGGKTILYHEFTRSTQKIDFLDPLSVRERRQGTNPTLLDFYPDNRTPNDTLLRFDSAGTMARTPDTLILQRSDTIRYRTEFLQVEHTIGFKNLFLDSRLLFIAYIKLRTLSESRSLTTPSTTDVYSRPFYAASLFNGANPGHTAQLSQLHGGIGARFQLADSTHLRLLYEQLTLQTVQTANDTLRSVLRNNADYSATAEFRHHSLQAGLTTRRSAATWQQAYLNHPLYYWANVFAPILLHEAYAAHSFSAARQSFYLRPSLLQIQNHVYYGTDRRPTQYSGILTYAQFEYAAYLGIGMARLDLTGRYAYQLTGNYIIRFPNLFLHLRPHIDIMPRRKRGLQQFNIGIDLNFRSGYYGDAYMPALLQFHMQNDFYLEPYMLADFFATARIRNARVFLRVNQINQLFGSNGYYVTPYYTGIRSLAVLGFVWQLFDD